MINVLMAEVLRLMDSELDLGFAALDSQSISEFLNTVITYADDVLFSSEDRDALASIIKSFIKYTACLGLSLAEDKTYLLATKYGLEEPDKSPLNITGTDINLEFTDSVTYLGYGLKEAPLNVLDHMAIRDAKKNETEGLKTAKKLRYIFKGDIAIIRN